MEKKNLKKKVECKTTHKTAYLTSINMNFDQFVEFMLLKTFFTCNQSRLNSIIGPLAKQYTEPIPTQPLTEIKLNFDKI